MKRSELKFMTDWESRRKSGRLKYCLLDGSVFGLIMLLFVEGLTYFLEANYTFTWSRLALAFGVWVLGGIAIYGPLMWAMNGYYYKKFSKKYALYLQERDQSKKGI